MKVNDENIGKLFQQTLKDVEVQPDAAVWAAVQKQAGISSGISLFAKVALGVLIAAVAVSTYFLWPKDKSVEPLAKTNTTENISPKVVPEVQQTPAKVDSKPQINKTENTTSAQKSSQKEAKENTTKVSLELCKDSPKEEIEEVKPVAAKMNTDFIRAKPEDQKPEDEIYQPVLVNFEDDETEIAKENQNVKADAEEVSTSNSDTSKIQFSDDPVICFGEDAILEVKGGESYEWSNGATTSKIKVSPVEATTTYWVIVHDKNSRQIKHDFTVSVDRECTSVFIPSAFTPNGDGINDEFKAEGLGIQIFEMVIYSREGKIIFESNNIDMAWDGTLHGEAAKPLTYIYQVVYTDAKGYIHTKKGNITLIR